MITATKSFEYKANNLKKGNFFTVRTKGIELPEGKTVVKNHSESVTSKYNVYTVSSKGQLDKMIDMYWDFKPQFNWVD